MGICHPQPLGPLIHHVHKGLLVPGYVLCHGHAGVISRGNDNTFDHGLHGLHFPLFQKHLGSSHRLGIGAGYHLIRHGDLPALQRVKNKNQGHDLGDAGRASLLVRVFLINHLPG